MPHIHEKIDFTASVFIVNGDAVLLRMHEKYHKFLPVGGHIELHEDTNDAAIREAKEESGLDVTLVGDISQAPCDHGGIGFKNLLPPRFMNVHDTTKAGHQHIDHIYFARSDTRTIAPHPTEANVDIRWFTKEELDDPRYDLYPSTRYYAKIALTELSL